jgi:hypothetical protein
VVEQPSGRVTLVFTDIEGSTRLLSELGQDRYLEVLARHRDVVRAAFGRFGGYEVDYEGDAFFYAFASAGEAVRAVSEAMVGLRDGPSRFVWACTRASPAWIHPSTWAWMCTAPRASWPPAKAGRCCSHGPPARS